MNDQNNNIFGNVGTPINNNGVATNVNGNGVVGGVNNLGATTQQGMFSNMVSNNPVNGVDVPVGNVVPNVVDNGVNNLGNNVVMPEVKSNNVVEPNLNNNLTNNSVFGDDALNTMPVNNNNGVSSSNLNDNMSFDLPATNNTNVIDNNVSNDINNNLNVAPVVTPSTNDSLGSNINTQLNANSNVVQPGIGVNNSNNNVASDANVKEGNASSSNDELAPVISVKKFLLYMILPLIPVVGPFIWLIVIIVKAFDKKNKNIKNYAVANLIMILISTIYAIIIGALMMFLFTKFIGDTVNSLGNIFSDMNIQEGVNDYDDNTDGYIDESIDDSFDDSGIYETPDENIDDSMNMDDTTNIDDTAILG